MMNKNILYLIMGVVLVNYSCKSKEEVFKPLPPKTTSLTLDTLWRSFIGGYSINPIMNSRKDILMSKVFYNPVGEIFKMFDGETGKLKWEWHDYYRPEEGFYDNGHILINDILILAASRNTYALNTLTGKTLWRTQPTNMYGEYKIFKDEDGYIYQGFRSNGHLWCFLKDD
jgi:outer membrane protein assembly factor BamB